MDRDAAAQDAVARIGVRERVVRVIARANLEDEAVARVPSQVCLGRTRRVISLASIRAISSERSMPRI